MARLVDMHMHAGFATDPTLLAHALAQVGVACFSNTVTPGEYRTLVPSFAHVPNARLGVGLHPWWIPGDDSFALTTALRAFDEALEETRFVGEAGLDFWPSRAGNRAEQLEVFGHVARRCAQGGDYLLSLHCVHAGRELLDILEDTGCPGRSTCILHSFAGSSDELCRAVDMGCLFSIGRRMLATKRGREYARVLPEDRLLLESDLPGHEGDACDAARIVDELAATLETLAGIRGIDVEDLRGRIAARSLGLLGM